MRALLVVVAAVFLVHVNAHAIPACMAKVKEELSRQSLDWKKSESENADSSAMDDEYHEQQDLVFQIEATIPNPEKPKRAKFKTSQAYKKAEAEWREMTKQASATRMRVLSEKRPDYRSAQAILEKYKAPENEFFYDYVRSGLAGFDQILYFPSKAKAKVMAYVQNGRAQGYRSVQSNGDRDVALFNGECEIEALTIHHSKLTELVRSPLCDDLYQLKNLVARAAADPVAIEDEEMSLDDICQEQGGEWDGSRCHCPGVWKGKLLAEVDPISDTCFDERKVSDVQRLSEFTVANESNIEPSNDSYAAAERVCKRYYGVTVKAPASSTEPAPAKSAPSLK